MSEQDDAKVKDDKGKDGTPDAEKEAKAATEKAASDKAAAEKAEKPEDKSDEGEITSENAVAKAKTFQGMLQKTQTELNELKGQRKDYASLSQLVSQQSQQITDMGDSLNILTEIVSTGPDMSEEAQEKVKQARTKQAANRETFQKGAQTMARIEKLAKAADLDMESDALKPAREAYNKGNMDEAIDLTVIASLGAKPAKPDPEADPDADKTKVKPEDKILKKAPVSKSTDDMTSQEKVQLGMEEARRKQSK